MTSIATLPQVSLEQWAAFCAVVEEGSFARAAERLNKSQSGVSYAIAKLEERLPAPVFKLSGRKAELTDVGRYLYRQAVNLLEQAHAIDRNAAVLAQGWEDEITLAADALVPMPKLFAVLHQFSETCPTTRVRILETTLSGTDEALLERRAQIALSPSVPTGFLAERLWQVDMIAVASASHGLIQQPQPITEHALKRERQIVVRDSGRRRAKNSGWLLSDQRWTVSHFASSIEAVKAGLGFAFLPTSHIQRELESGELAPIALAVDASRSLHIHMVIADQSNAGPAVKVLADRLRCAGK